MMIDEEVVGCRTRKRRRRFNGEPILGQLVLDEELKGDVGLVSDDLWEEVFPDIVSLGNETKQSLKSQTYIAISLWNPLVERIEDDDWTIIAVESKKNDTGSSDAISLANSTVRFPASSHVLQSIAKDSSYHTVKAYGPGRRIATIRIIDIVPLPLTTIYVNVDGEELQKYQKTQEQYGGGFVDKDISASSKNEVSVADQNLRGIEAEDRKNLPDHLPNAVREALSHPRIIRDDISIPLPWPPHPITHAPPPSVRITSCKPVRQGVLVPETEIILTRFARTRYSPSVGKKILALKPHSQEVEDENSTEQFYSAAEDREHTGDSSFVNTSSYGLSESMSPENDSHGSSEESLDDMVSLSTTVLQTSPSIISSPFANSYPLAVLRGTDGNNSPKSMISSYTTTTIRPFPNSGQIFTAIPLLRSIPEVALHPKPSGDEDENCRIFVHVNVLRKVARFSGDWVRVEPLTGKLEPNALDSLDSKALDSDNKDWRALKIYVLPEPLSNNSQYRRDSHFQKQDDYDNKANLTPSAYLSPVLLHNLQGAKYLNILPFVYPTNESSNQFGDKSRSPKIEPPSAKEVTLLRINSRLTTERALQSAILSNLKAYFEKQTRLVKNGDLIAIPIDENLARTFFTNKTVPTDVEPTEDVSLDSICDALQEIDCNQEKKIGIVWFKVGQLNITRSSGQATQDMVDVWGGMAAIDPLGTRMVQSGSENCRVPKSSENPWEYYFGIKTIPRIGLQPMYHGILSQPPLPYLNNVRKRLCELITVATSPQAVRLRIPPTIVLLSSTQRGVGKHFAAVRSCAEMGIHSFTIDAYDIMTEGGVNGGDVKTEAYLKSRCDRAMSCGPSNVSVIIRHIEILTADRMVLALKDVFDHARITICTTTETGKISDGIRNQFTHEIEISAPDEREREDIVGDIVLDRGLRLASDVDLAGVAVKTAALVAGDLVDVVDRAQISRQHRLEEIAEAAAKTSANIYASTRDVFISGGEEVLCLAKADFSVAVDAARKNFADAIGAPKIPNVTWDDVGGLSNVKDAIMETIQLPLERPELFAKGMKKRSGILFYGPPGTGKTLLAKAIATEFSLNFFSVKGPELLNMYIGESEANVRRVFQRARDARPCVVFFDELDSVAPKRGNQGDSGGVMDRIVSQLLAELDGMSSGDPAAGGVFVIGATNRPDLLDQALLRPGRFDKMLYLGVSDTHEKQLTILEALSRKFILHPDLSLRRVAETLPFTYTGADLYALCSDAMLKAITRQAAAVDAKIRSMAEPVTTAYFFDHLATAEDVAVMVTEEDFFAANAELVPSVSANELQHYERVRRTFEASDEKKKAILENSLDLPVATAPTFGHQSDYQVDGYENNSSEGNHLHMNGRLNKSINSDKRKGKERLVGNEGLFTDPSRNDDDELYGQN